jgi:hypothetical protein
MSAGEITRLLRRMSDESGDARKHTYDDLNRLKTVEITAGLAGEGPTGVIAEYGYDLRVKDFLSAAGTKDPGGKPATENPKEGTPKLKQP